MDLRNILNDSAQPPPPPRRSMSDRRESTSSAISVSPKTMPPPTPITKMSSPFESRKRSYGSMSQPPPPPKRRKYEGPPIWAIRFDRSREKPKRPHDIVAASSPAPQSRQETPIKREPSQSTLVNGASRPTIKTERHANGSNGPTQLATVSDETPPGLEPNFDNIIPFNDITKIVADSIFNYIVQFPAPLDENTHWEIEAKLGQLEHINPPQRLNLPVQTETLLNSDHLQTRFVSKMDLAQHRFLNDYLNRATQISVKRPDRQSIAYKHTQEIDSFYDFPERLVSELGEAAQQVRSLKPNRPIGVRVTRDKKTDAILATIIKFRVVDLDVLCPGRSFDYRISLSLEYNYPYPVDTLQESNKPSRSKDRISYKHQCYQMDLTQVSDVGGAGGANTSHEMEVEMDAKTIIEEGIKARDGGPNEFLPRIHVFLNYIRALSRADMR